MSTPTLERPRTAAPTRDPRPDPRPDPRADLRAAHLAATAAVAGLDLDDRRAWRRVDRTVAELAAAAERLTAAITGEQRGVSTRRVPPVVRVRTLVTAQQRLFAALDRHPAPEPELLARAARAVLTAASVLGSWARDPGDRARA